jgi:hypothetical protein
MPLEENIMSAAGVQRWIGGRSVMIHASESVEVAASPTKAGNIRPSP